MSGLANPSESASASPAALLDRLYRMSVGRYNRLVEAGLLGPKDRVYLWKGLLVAKMPKGRPHVVAQNRIGKWLRQLVPEGWYVEQDQPLEIGKHSVPEPDLKVVRGSLDDYLNRNPTPADVSLVVEVADTSLADDFREMVETYARAGIAVYWIINLPRRRIDVFTAPSGPTEAPSYREHKEYGPDDDVPVVLDGVEVGRVAVNDVLP